MPNKDNTEIKDAVNDVINSKKELRRIEDFLQDSEDFFEFFTNFHFLETVWRIFLINILIVFLFSARICIICLNLIEKSSLFFHSTSCSLFNSLKRFSFEWFLPLFWRMLEKFSRISARFKTQFNYKYKDNNDHYSNDNDRYNVESLMIIWRAVVVAIWQRTG